VFGHKKLQTVNVFTASITAHHTFCRKN